MNHRFAVAPMPFNPKGDDHLYRDEGVYLNGRAENFANVSLSVMKEAGILDEVLSAKRLLDLGCGPGWLLHKLRPMMKDLNAKLFGFDPCEGAEKMVHTDGDFEFFSTPPRKQLPFDVVMSWHVLEHTDDPEDFIKEQVWLTRVHGLSIFCTPNAGSPFAKDPNWRCYIPSHKYLLTKAQLNDIIDDAGAKPIKTFTWGGYAAPRKWYQEQLNQINKRLGRGDVMMVAARRRDF